MTPTNVLCYIPIGEPVGQPKGRENGFLFYRMFTKLSIIFQTDVL